MIEIQLSQPFRNLYKKKGEIPVLEAPPSPNKAYILDANPEPQTVVKFI